VLVSCRKLILDIKIWRVFSTGAIRPLEIATCLWMKEAEYKGKER
jgi:hypothetical protein